MPITPDTTLLGKYRILRPIGEGGMARVWLAEEITFGNRQVAIKEPRQDLSPLERDELWRRYQQEIQVYAALQKARAAHIVPVHTVEPYDNRALLVMDYMAGGNLAERIAAHPDGLPVEQALAITRSILTALSSAHEHPLEIVHRDLKPANILFDERGEAYLADFGLAQISGASGRSQLAGGSHPGSPLYMAPEQASSADYLSPAADIFALGCLLFEMLTGKRYKRVRPGTSLRSLRADLPAWLDEVAGRSLSEDPWERYVDAGEMLVALAAERSEREAKERAEREAKERAEREAKERAEREAKEQAKQEAAEKARQEAALEAERKIEEEAHFYYNRALAAAANKNHTQAIIDCSRAIEIDPNYQDARKALAAYYQQRGSHHYNQGNVKDFVADYTRAIELEPNNTEYRKILAGHYWTNADYVDAVKIEPDNIEYRKALAHNYYLNKEYNSAIEQDPTNPVYYYERGKSFRLQGEISLRSYQDENNRRTQSQQRGSEFHIRPVREISDLSKQMQRREGAIYAHFANAIEDYNSAIKFDPSNPIYYYERGLAYISGVYRDPEKAMANFTKSIELNPDNADCYYERGKLHLNVGDVEKTSLELRQKVNEIRRKRGEISDDDEISQDYTVTAYYIKAFNEFTTAIELNAHRADFLYMRGVSYEKLNKPAEAQADFRRAAELGHEDARRRIK